MMTEPAAVIRENIRELTEKQIDTLARRTSLTNSDLREYLQRSAQIENLCLALNKIDSDFTPVLRRTKNGRRVRFQIGAV
jgi:hypothetical protein